MAHSPLARAAETASIIWAGNESARDNNNNSSSSSRPPAVVPLPSLREIDLHSFQGLLKSDGFSGRHAAAYATWKSNPEGFEIDGKAPVRDLWERAGEAWRELSGNLVAPVPSSPSSSAPSPRFLVVAHNAVNQALISVAIGLPPRAFRRIVQSNGCVTELALSFPKGEGKGEENANLLENSSSLSSFAPSPSAATVLRLNVGPRPPLKLPERAGGVALVVFVSLGGEESESSRRSSSFARALFGEEGEKEGKFPFEDAPLVLPDPLNSSREEAAPFSLAAVAEAAGFDRRAVEKAAAAASLKQQPSSPSPPSSCSSSFWRAAATAAASSPRGVAVAIGNKEQVEEALRESISDLFVEGDGERGAKAARKNSGGVVSSFSSPPSSSSSFISAPAGGVSVVEVDSAAVAAGVFAGTLRCANWRPAKQRGVQEEEDEEAGVAA